MENKNLVTNALNLEINTFKNSCRIILDELAEDYSNNSGNYLDFNNNEEVIDRVFSKAFRLLENSEYKLITQCTDFLGWLNEINEISNKNELFILFNLDGLLDEFTDIYDDFLSNYEENYSSYYVEEDSSFDNDSSW